MRFVCLALVLAFVPWMAAGQDPVDPKDKGERSLLFEDAMGEKLGKDILGAWQLTDCLVRGELVPRGAAAGYAVFAESYMALEVHMQLAQSMPDTDGLFFRTGIRRWRIGNLGRMQTSTLIGTHNLNDHEDVLFERPGARIDYRAELHGGVLLLESDLDTRLTFVRMAPMPFPDADPLNDPALDAFGRKQEPEAPKDRKKP